MFADYDVDGATSAAQLVRWFRAMGRELPIYVPDRMTEGYGPSPAAFQHIRAQGAELVVTVDCGAAAYDAIAAAGRDRARRGRHRPSPDARDAAGGGRRRQPEPSRLPLGPGRAGRGGRHLRAAGGAEPRSEAAGPVRGARPSPTCANGWISRRWARSATSPRFTGFNRALVGQGLKVMSAWGNPGLKALLDVAGAKGPASVFHAGFILGPRINAGGRIGRSDLGARLLSTDDPDEARALALELDALNARAQGRRARHPRRGDRGSSSGRPTSIRPRRSCVVAAEGWHPGVIGIVASRLRERYRKPAVVIGLDPVTDIGKGSGRSQPGVNLGRAIQAAFDEGLLLAGGGHAMAAGLTVRADAVPELRAFLVRALADERVEAEAADAVEIDALITPGAATRPLWQDFERLQPFGPGNPEPLFALADVRVERAHPDARRPYPLPAGRRRRARGCARSPGESATTELGQRLAAGGALHVAGRLKPDDWNGRAGVAAGDRRRRRSAHERPDRAARLAKAG